ncbi:MAG: 3-dehydroquinate synthase family protein [Planctomycetota bacterium]
MTTIEVGGRRPYPVRIERGVLARAAALASDRSVALVSDTTVAPLHRERLALPDASLYAMAPGEASKSLVELEGVLDFLAEAHVDRRGLVITLGGGVVTDLGGLAASLYLRGVDVVHAPTTLLAQVDAAIGGKTAVNLAAGKNLAGTIHPPAEVLIDPEVLATQSDGDFRAGLAEVVKSALVGAPALLELLEAEADAVLARDPAVLERVLVDAVGVKARIVTSDELEQGERATLNLGHTFAHAIEHAAGYGRVPHGVAVGVGLALALEASERAGRLQDAALGPRIERLLERLGLFRSLDELARRYDLDLTTKALITGLRHDKKGRAGEPAFVLVRRAGDVLWQQRLEPGLWRSLLAGRDIR